MLYNGDTFGAYKDALKDSVYVNDNWDETLLPPPGAFFLLNDDSIELLDDSGINLLTP